MYSVLNELSEQMYSYTLHTFVLLVVKIVESLQRILKHGFLQSKSVVTACITWYKKVYVDTTI